jgi:hypothetical protein
MKELINDQTIDFDIHRAGDGQGVSIDGLHMHKRMNGKNFKGVDILFPLDNKENFEFRPKSTTNKIQIKLMNEIRRAVKKNPIKRNELIDTIFEEIQRHSNNKSSIDDIGILRRGATRIAVFFSKEGKVRNELLQKIENKIEFLITEHSKEEISEGSGHFFIKQDLKRNRIKISDDLESLNYGNRKRKFK